MWLVAFWFVGQQLALLALCKRIESLEECRRKCETQQ
jgi:hypothetical protein